jgi:hypothetical protein
MPVAYCPCLTNNNNIMTIDEKRERLMESVFEQVGDRDIREMLMDGILGFNQMSDADIEERYKEIYED